MHYLPNDTTEKEMLERMGLDSISDLFSDIPEELRIDGLSLLPGQSELEVMRDAHEKMNRSRGAGDMLMFLGGGVYDHFIPVSVDNVASRSELYTSYTPYQPEMSQGILQAMFEYQSMMSDLLKMDAVNSSMYDHHTAIGEAVLMSHRFNHKKKFLIPEFLSRDKQCVVENYSKGANIELHTIPYEREKAVMDLDALETMIDEDVSGVYIENPNIMGLYDAGALKIKEMLGKRQLLVVGINPMTMSIAKPPGEYGADIVVGDAQPLGIHMSYGGPTTGIFATSMKLVRKMPGRIIGATEDALGRRAFCMTLSTREQHIRRERATSNICTNEALTSIVAAAYLASMGKKGFRDLGLQLASRAKYLADRINDLEGFNAPAYPGRFFNEFPVRADVDVCSLLDVSENKGVLSGVNVSGEIDGVDDVFTVTTTEMHTSKDYDRLVEVLKEAREVVA